MQQELVLANGEAFIKQVLHATFPAFNHQEVTLQAQVICVGFSDGLTPASSQISKQLPTPFQRGREKKLERTEAMEFVGQDKDKLNCSPINIVGKTDLTQGIKLTLLSVKVNTELLLCVLTNIEANPSQVKIHSQTYFTPDISPTLLSLQATLSLFSDAVAGAQD